MSEPIRISKHIPARTERYEVIWLVPKFQAMNQNWRRIRSRFSYKGDKCWWCKHPFEDGEMMGMMCIKKKGNRVVCQTCAGLIEKGEE